MHRPPITGQHEARIPGLSPEFVAVILKSRASLVFQNLSIHICKFHVLNDLEGLSRLLILSTRVASYKWFPYTVKTKWDPVTIAYTAAFVMIWYISA